MRFQLGSQAIKDAEDLTILTFAPDFLTAETSAGVTVSFTRSEARALAALAQNPLRLLTRDQLLDAVSGEASEKSDRNIDFVINRLRRKLADNARNPRYIATRYGEGYVWIGPSAAARPAPIHADLVVGPYNGIAYLQEHRETAERFASELYLSLKAALPRGRKSVLIPDYTPPAAGSETGGPKQSVDLTFFVENGVLDCVATARETHSGRILAIRRLSLDDANRSALDLRKTVDALAAFLLNESWRVLATLPEREGPLPVAMYTAGARDDLGKGSGQDSDKKLLNLLEQHERQNMDCWKQTERRLRELRADSPDDAELKLMHATHLHTKYVMFGVQIFMSESDDRKADEDLIESLVLDALPYVQAKSDHVIMAAKLLHFLDRGYRELALDLAEAAYRDSVSVASSLAIIGQLRAFAGDTGAAIRCLDQALNLSSPKSKSWLYALVLKCQALMAVADYDRLSETKRQLYAGSPMASLIFEPLFSDAEKPSLRAKLAMMAFSRARARAILQFSNYLSARLFHIPEHAENAIRTPLSLVVGRHGADAVPEEVVAAFPTLISQLR